ncbi:uncharacterized protein EMH_0014480 [Eimeria mitis]|uniref:NIF system FeS cluster assembly NifU C-terminal domain-containing protein n=1 Tax=Eimeria mitis TaxID=44415 RepID=U6K857_9EIME|nr:uncharacterized protein EMH_0014480 [Eimeria mitis]CDJ33006.1 hypothetical protein, conserved [Eimeria mitis]
MFTLFRGACSGCPSSALTLRGGIEAALQDVWGGVRGLVPAIERMGGAVDAYQQPSGGVTLRYVGPNAATVRYGLEMELQDKLPAAA